MLFDIIESKKYNIEVSGSRQLFICVVSCRAVGRAKVLSFPILLP